MSAFDLTIKDLSQILRDRKSLMFILIMPIAFTLMFGFVFGGYGAPADTRLLVVVAGDTGDPAHAAFVDLVESSTVVRVATPASMDDQALRASVTDGKVTAVVFIPAGFLRTCYDGINPVLPCVVDVASTSGTIARNELGNLSTRLTSAVRTARATAAIYREVATPSASNKPSTLTFEQFTYAFETAVSAWKKQPQTVVVTVSSKLTEQQRNAGGFAHTSPSMMLQFSIAGLISAAGIVVEERKSRTLARLMTTRLSRSGILLGHYLAMFVQVFAQLSMLILFAALVLRVQYMHAPFATLFVTICASAFVAAIGLLIGVASRSEEQAIAFSLILMFVLAGLGGAWVPLQFTGAAFQRVARATPGALIVDAYENVVQRGLGVSSVLWPCTLLLVCAIVLAALAALRFRRQSA
ncbi:MAG: ABC transporter permease [Caldiserica bacterium]|nr:ABC transporter permease [Caldisericota bacterium]